jgi:CheY-like chemotaxis protein
MVRARAPILVIDDHEATRNAIERLLCFYGYSVVKTVDGQQGLEYLAAGNAVSAILVDVEMPRMDAQAFRDRQLSDPVLAGIPVIVFTGKLAEALPGVAGIVRKTDPGTMLALLDQCVRDEQPRADPKLP